MDPLKIVTVQTDRNEALDNWIYTAKGNGYDYAILGLDEKWGGWSWRTKKYLKYVESLPSNSIICLADCNDILFVKPLEDLRSAWRHYSSLGHELVFGGEPTCCTGEYRFHVNPIARKKVMDKVKQFNPKNRWMFPNAGCVIGTKKRIVEALNIAKDAPDDQAAYLKRYSEDESWLTIDYDHKIVGNFNSLAYLYSKGVLPADYYRGEMKHWEYTTQYKHSVIPDRSYVEGTVDNESWVHLLEKPPTGRQLRNKHTGGTPAIIHFPGKNFLLYNEIGGYLFGKEFKRLEFHDSMTSLWSVSNLWK